MLGEVFPGAQGHLAAVVAARSDLATVWSAVLDGGLTSISVGCDDDGVGAVVAEAWWPEGARQDLTRLFRTVVDELWAVLDSLVEESVEMFSAQRRRREPSRPRFFPIADSDEALEALLEEACLDGLLVEQYRLVRLIQPHLGEDEDPRVNHMRRALRQLVEWAEALDRGALIGAWLTVGEPVVGVNPPSVVERLVTEPSGELGDEERIVARFVVSAYTDDCGLWCQANSYVDLAFADGFVPTGPDDTLYRRIRSVVDAVRRIGMLFVHYVSTVPVAHSVGPAPAHTETWIPVHDSDRAWTPDDLQALADSDIGVGVVTGAEHPVLLIQTDAGVYERRIPGPTALNPHLSRGTAAELTTRNAAATWGLPDFVVRPAVERKGRGVREISDGLIAIGDKVLVVQVKSRDTEPHDSDREVSWINKKIHEAGRQVDGTVRRLSTTRTAMLNGRGRTIHIDGAAATWLGVIILDHPAPPRGHTPSLPATRTPTVTLLRRDWEFLYSQLKSSHAVIGYLERVVSDPPVPLGDEPLRYYELAAADVETTRQTTSAEQSGGGLSVSIPLLPTAPAGSDDEQAHALVRLICEDIANTETNDDDEDQRVRVLATIDALSVGFRTDLGRLLLDMLAIAPTTKHDTVRWQFRSFRSQPPDPHLGFGVCTRFDDSVRNAFHSWLLLRHYEHGTQRGDLDTLTSVGVLLTPNTTGRRDWDTTTLAITGDPKLTPEELESSIRLWNNTTSQPHTS